MKTSKKLNKLIVLAVLLGGVTLAPMAEAGYTGIGYDGQVVYVSGTASGVGGGSFASGVQNTVSGSYSAAIGTGNNVAGPCSLGFGQDNSIGSGAQKAFALGCENQANAYASTAIGYRNRANGYASVAMGYGSKTWTEGSIAFGQSYAGGTSSAATSGANYAFAAGYQSTASAAHSVAMGYQNTASGGFSVAMGSGNTASGAYSVAMGFESKAWKAGSVAFGKSYAGGISSAATDGADYAFAAGYESAASGTYSVAMGNFSKAFGKGSVALGGSTAGVFGTTAGTDTYAFAAGASTAKGAYSVAMGNGAVATPDNSFAFGGTVASGHTASVALGYGSTTGGEYEVSVGSSTQTRKITNVTSAGTLSDTNTNAATGADVFNAITMGTTAGNIYAANDNVVTAVKSIDTKIGALSGTATYNYIAASNTVSANLSALDLQVKTNATNIGTNTTAITKLNGADTVEGSVAYSIKSAFDTKVGTVSGTVNYITAANTVSANLIALDTKIGTIATDGTYAKQANTVSANLIALDSAVVKLNADSTTAGSVDYKIAQALSGSFTAADVTATSFKVGGNTYISSTGLNANSNKITNVTAGSADTDAVNYGQLSATNTNVANLTTKVGTMDTDKNYVKAANSVSQNLIDLDTHVKTNANAIDILNADASTTGSVAKAVKDATTMPGNGNFYAQGDSVTAAIGSVDTKVKANETAIFGAFSAIGTLNGAATVSGSVANSIQTAFDNKVGTLDKDSYNIIHKEYNVSQNLEMLDKSVKGVMTESFFKPDLNDNAYMKVQKKITNVAEGDLSATSTDVVTGKQLYATNNRVAANESNISKIQNYVTDSGIDANNKQIINVASAGTLSSTNTNVANAADVYKAITMDKTGAYYVLGDSVTTAVKNIDAKVEGLIGKGDDVAKAEGDKSVAMGVKTTVTGTGSTGLGSSNVVVGDNSTAMGTDNNVTGEKSTVTGYNNIIVGDSSTAVGIGHKITGNNSNAFGDPHIIDGNRSNALGNDNNVYGDESTTLGNDNNVYGNENTAFGNNNNIGTSANPVNNSFALGNNTIVLGNNSVVLGNNSTATEDNVVSVGSETLQRKIVNVAPGENPYDAVNYAQYSDLANNMERRFSKVNEDIGRTGAASAALASLHPQMMRKGESQVMAGMGRYHGKSGAAVGLAWQPHKRVMLSGGFADAAGEIMFNVGASYKFGQHSYTPEQLAEIYNGNGTPLYVAELNAVLKSKDAQINIIKADYATLKSDNAVMKEKLKKMDEMEAKLAKMEAMMAKLMENK